MTNTDTNTPQNFRLNAEETQQLLDTIGEALLEKKAEQIKLLNVTGLTTLTDYFFVCHGNSDTQVKAIADNVTEKTRHILGEYEWRKEGFDTRRWIVLDYVNVVVHIFNQEARSFYALEKMWNDAEVTDITD